MATLGMMNVTKQQPQPRTEHNDDDDDTTAMPVASSVMGCMSSPRTTTQHRTSTGSTPTTTSSSTGSSSKDEAQRRGLLTLMMTRFSSTPLQEASYTEADEKKLRQQLEQQHQQQLLLSELQFDASLTQPERNYLSSLIQSGDANSIQSASAALSDEEIFPHPQQLQMSDDENERDDDRRPIGDGDDDENNNSMKGEIEYSSSMIDEEEEEDEDDHNAKNDKEVDGPNEIPSGSARSTTGTRRIIKPVRDSELQQQLFRVHEETEENILPSELYQRMNFVHQNSILSLSVNNNNENDNSECFSSRESSFRLGSASPLLDESSFLRLGSASPLSAVEPIVEEQQPAQHQEEVETAVVGEDVAQLLPLEQQLVIIDPPPTSIVVDNAPVTLDTIPSSTAEIEKDETSDLDLIAKKNDEQLEQRQNFDVTMPVSKIDADIHDDDDDRFVEKKEDETSCRIQNWSRTDHTLDATTMTTTRQSANNNTHDSEIMMYHDHQQGAGAAASSSAWNPFDDISSWLDGSQGVEVTGSGVDADHKIAGVDDNEAEYDQEENIQAEDNQNTTDPKRHSETGRRSVGKSTGGYPTTNYTNPAPFKIVGTSADDVSCHPHVLSPPLMESLLAFVPEYHQTTTTAAHGLSTTATMTTESSSSVEKEEANIFTTNKTTTTAEHYCHQLQCPQDTTTTTTTSIKAGSDLTKLVASDVPTNSIPLQPISNTSSSSYNFWLKYSLVRDGPSLYTFLRQVRASTLCFLAIETDEGHVFGAFTSQPWRLSKGWYGSKDTFLWKMRRSRLETAGKSIVERVCQESEIQVYPYRTGNAAVQYCSKKCLMLGQGEIIPSPRLHNPDKPLRPIGKASSKHYGYALYLDKDLTTGTTSSSETFGNPCLIDPNQRGARFTVSNIEVWTLTPHDTVAEAEQSELSNLFLDGGRDSTHRLNFMNILVGGPI